MKLKDDETLETTPRYSVSPLQCTLAYLLLAAVRAPPHLLDAPSYLLLDCLHAHALLTSRYAQAALLSFTHACPSSPQICLLFWALQKNFPAS